MRLYPIHFLQSKTELPASPPPAAIVELASQFGSYGYRGITALLRHRGWHENYKRVERIWRREGLKVPAK